ncbi:MAG TPA: hypothetical protein DFS52_21605 [Myxococcales bacterium]|nr:hypothetical protein [Myxococcales bacterium]
MSRALKLAVGCHLVVALGAAAMGLVYLFSPRFMPYHAQVTGADWEAIPAGTQRLILAFQRGSGVAVIACALALFVLTLVPLRRGERWAMRAVPAVGLVGLVPLAVIIGRLGAETGAAVPLPPLLGAIGLLAGGGIASELAAGRKRR